MSEERKDANSERVCEGNGHILPGDSALAEGRNNPGGTGREHLANSLVAGRSLPEARAQAEAGAPEESEEVDPFTLPYVMMSELHYLPTCAGIYFAIEETNVIAYIGQSLNIRTRWRAHHVQGDLCDLGRLDSARRVRIAWLEIADTARLLPMERALIIRFAPRLNSAYAPKPPRKTFSVERASATTAPGYVAPSEFAKMAGVSYHTAVRWVREGLIQGVQVVGTGDYKLYMVPESALTEFEPPKKGPKPKPKKAAKKATKK